jgi:pimeloyl-ACP methyl ester carboxylesterase
LAGQILLDPWLLGKPHADAIADVCNDPATLEAVSEAVGVACVGSNACSCATTNARSRYNYTYTNDRQETRIREANLAHVLPEKAAQLFGVALDSIVGLAASERSKGFKCDEIDANAPPQDELFSLLGALPSGQAYFLPYSPLQPGKELEPTPADWRDAAIVGTAFVDNLRDVPIFVTDGARDLVVPTRALAPALRAVMSDGAVVEQASGNIDVDFDDLTRTIAVSRYPAAGHMITMIEPEAFEHDVAAWLSTLP